MIYPRTSLVEACHEQTPDHIKAIYLEAAAISAASPRGAAALMRVALELLTHELGANPKKRINEKIGKLAQDGLPREIIRALDVLRVTGNEAAHSTETLLMDDDADAANSLFELFNYIVDQMIALPKRRDAMYDRPPATVREQIALRDETTSQKQTDE